MSRRSFPGSLALTAVVLATLLMGDAVATVPYTPVPGTPVGLGPILPAPSTVA